MEGSANAQAEDKVVAGENQPTTASTDTVDLIEQPETKRRKIEEDTKDGSENEDNEENVEEDEEEESDNDDYYVGESMMFEDDSTEHEHLKEDVAAAAKAWPKLERDLCIPSVQIEPSINGFDGECSVVLTFNVSDLPGAVLLPNLKDPKSEEARLAWHLWDLDTASTISVIVDGIHKGQFRAFQRRPEVLARIDRDKPSKFPIGECLINIAKPIITSTFTLTENVSPSEAGSFFSMLYEHFMGRFETLTQFCLVCGAKLKSGAILPSICDGGLCEYQFKELGLVEGLTNPRCSAPVLSLLLTAFNAASNSTRWKDILTPAPTPNDVSKLIEESKQLYEDINCEWIFNQKAGLDVHSMLVRAMPCAHDILKTPAHYREFKQKFPNVAEFIEWLVITNHSFLEIVPSSLRVAYLKTNMQFLFVSDTPEKQAQFDLLKQEKGGKTRYLFHGSKMENWHSIIRSGLKNMSGTKYQLVGAAYGAGIYLSNSISTSFAYTTHFDDSNISAHCLDNGCCFSMVNKGGMSLLAVVEVVDHPDAYRYNQLHDGGKNTIVVVKEEKWCSIRMLVAYPSKKPPSIDLDKITATARQQIESLRSFTRPQSTTKAPTTRKRRGKR